eukprot:scaffold19796_cov122-Isochrysis_galbana.AAC.1
MQGGSLQTGAAKGFPAAARYPPLYWGWGGGGTTPGGRRLEAGEAGPTSSLTLREGPLFKFKASTAFRAETESGKNDSSSRACVAIRELCRCSARSRNSASKSSADDAHSQMLHAGRSQLAAGSGSASCPELRKGKSKRQARRQQQQQKSSVCACVL